MSPEMWDYSNYLEWVEIREGTLVNRDFIRENFGTPDEYKVFVKDYFQNRHTDDDFLKYIHEVES